MYPLKREQARRETQQWVMRRLPTADSIVEIGRKSRSWIKDVMDAGEKSGKKLEMRGTA